MFKEQKIVNYVSLVGKIVGNSKRNDGTRHITLYSTSGKKDTYPSFICAEELIKDFRIHSRIEVKGHVISYIQKKDDKNLRIQRIVADEVKPAKTITESIFGIKGKFYDSFNSTYYAKGIVSKIKEDNQYIQYIVQFPDKEKMRSVLLKMKKPDRLPDIKTNSKVCFVCNIMSKQKITKSGNTDYYQDFIIQDLAIAEY